MAKFEELFGKDEELDPELALYLVTNKWQIISHPLVVEVPYHREMNALINARFVQKKKSLEEARLANDWNRFVFLHERPYRIDALQIALRSGLRDNAAAMNELIQSTWIDSENIRQNQKAWIQIWSSLDNPQQTMDPTDAAAFKKLPETIEIYRGVRNPHFNKNGLSWTTDIAKAHWFAKRWSGAKDSMPLLLTGQVAKQKVFAHFTGRNESEIVVLPKFVRNKKEELV